MCKPARVFKNERHKCSKLYSAQSKNPHSTLRVRAVLLGSAAALEEK